MAMGLFSLMLASCGGSGTTGPNTNSSASLPAYPLKVSSNGRYLVDQKNSPFLIVGDSPQALMVNLSIADAEVYLADRAKKGFNAVWVNLLCADYTGGRPDGSTITGIVPFTTPQDFSTPNEVYFSHSDAIIRLAAKYGLVVFLDPAETGSFLSWMLNNGTAKCTAYGQYLGNRYKSFNNIVWLNGNDFQAWSNPTNDAVVTSVAKGIKSVDPRHIQTIELDYLLSSSLNDPNWASIVQLNAAYTYYPTYAEVLRDYNLTPTVPVFLVESDYEFENGADNQRLRHEEYWTYLSGGFGAIYGNHYVWPFSSGWQSHLDTPGVTQLGYCKALLQARPWSTLIPDQNHKVVTAGYGAYISGGAAHSSISSNDYASVAATPNGRLVLAYVPTQRTVTVDMTKLSGRVTARWYDPTSGIYQTVTGSPFQNVGSKNFATPGVNSEGPASTDWVLVLEVNGK